LFNDGMTVRRYIAEQTTRPKKGRL